jgi:hypothetical protein
MLEPNTSLEFAYRVQSDAAGLAGTGNHTRAIVKTERLLEGARKRAAAR